MKARLSLVVGGSLLMSLTVSPNLLAGQDGTLEGCYVPARGHAESASYSTTEQLGQYRLLLTRKDGAAPERAMKQRAMHRVVIAGPFKGAQNEDLTLNHVLGTDDRNGFIFTAGDTFIPEAITPCNETGGVVLEGSEVLYPVAGAGIYSGLQGGGSVVVSGTVNTCTGLNDFEVVAGEGELCFSATGD